MALDYLRTTLQSPWQLAFAFAVLLGGTVLFPRLLSAARHTSGGGRRLPRFSGPRGLPLLGNYHQIGDKQWLQYTGMLSSSTLRRDVTDFTTEWHKIFGKNHCRQALLPFQVPHASRRPSTTCGHLA